LYQAADKAGMSEKTARKYLKRGQLPSELERVRSWQTRANPFKKDWRLIEELLEENSGLEAKTIFDWLQRTEPGRYQDGQLRTLQRHLKVWRMEYGPKREVMFSQIHLPGERAQSDFTSLNELKITIRGQLFEHMAFHFVLTYSNWESVSICYSESFESLSGGLQNALWELGAVPKYHQTDQLSAAVQKLGHPDEFTQRYDALLRHYGLIGKKIQVGAANENGDVEQSHHRLQRAIDQSLMLRGSREFMSIEDYETFLKTIVEQRNLARRDRLNDELLCLRSLPHKKLDQTKWVTKRVTQSSTIRIETNTYSVHSRLIGETLRVGVKANSIELWVAQKCVARFPRLRGKHKHRISYRHIIHSLYRKPGAFAQYQYKDDLYPSSWFRKAYDWLSEYTPSKASKYYLEILYLAATVSEEGVEKAIKWLLDESEPISPDSINALLSSRATLPDPKQVHIQAVHLQSYDQLIGALA
jgi:hypothetical protein